MAIPTMPDLSSLLGEVSPLIPPSSPAPTFDAPAAMPSAAPMQTGGGFNLGKTIQQLAPAIMAIMAQKQGGRPAAGAMLQGYTQALAQKRREQQSEEARALALARDEQERQRIVAEQEQRQREKAAAFLQGVAQDALQAPDEASLARYMDLAAKIGREVYGLDESDVRGVGGFNQAAADARAAEQATETVDRLMKLHGEQFPQLVESGATVRFRGHDTPIADLLSLANMPMRTETREAVVPLGLRGGAMPLTTQVQTPVLPEPKADEDVSGTSEWSNKVRARLRALGRKPTPEDVIRIQNEVTAEEEQLLRGRRTSDPTTAAINALRLEQMRGQMNAQGLPPKVQTQVNSQAAAFDRHGIVKRIQPMAEAVQFADSLDINTTNPADDQALIYAFAKAMDPESVVREGEYATVQKYAQDWASTFGFNAKRIFSNTHFLTPQARANMKRTIRDKYKAARTQYDNVRKGFAQRISRIAGVEDGSDYLIDYAAGFPSLDAATVKMRAPDGTVREVPADQVEHFKAKGAVVVGG